MWALCSLLSHLAPWVSFLLPSLLSSLHLIHDFLQYIRRFMPSVRKFVFALCSPSASSVCSSPLPFSPVKSVSYSWSLVSSASCISSTSLFACVLPDPRCSLPVSSCSSACSSCLFPSLLSRLSQLRQARCSLLPRRVIPGVFVTIARSAIPV